MKIWMKIVPAVFLVLSVSCTKNSDAEKRGDQDAVVKVYHEDYNPLTKTELNPSDMSVQWVEGDEVTLAAWADSAYPNGRTLVSLGQITSTIIKIEGEYCLSYPQQWTAGRVEIYALYPSKACQYFAEYDNKVFVAVDFTQLAGDNFSDANVCACCFAGSEVPTSTAVFHNIAAIVNLGSSKTLTNQAAATSGNPHFTGVLKYQFTTDPVNSTKFNYVYQDSDRCSSVSGQWIAVHPRYYNDGSDCCTSAGIPAGTTIGGNTVTSGLSPKANTIYYVK